MGHDLHKRLMDNFDQENIDNVRKQIEEGTEIPQMFGMFVNESGTGETPKITEESRKNCAKDLVK